LILIAIPLIVATVVGTYYYSYAKNQYTAVAKLYVIIDYKDSMGTMRYDISTSTSFAGDYQELITSHEVLSAAAKELNVANLDDLVIKVSSKANIRVINLSVTGADAAFTTSAANKISEVFIDYLSSITETKSVNIASKALVPVVPSGPKRAQNTALAFAVSLLLTAVVLIAVSVLNTTLRTSEDVESALHLPVLARVAGYKKEMDKFLSRKDARKPLFYSVSYDTRESIKTLAMNLQFASGGETVKTLAVTSATPNEGKSTVSVMLATSLAEEGKRVLLIDMDFRNPSLGKYLGVRNRQDIVDVLQGNAKIDKVITETNVKNLYMVDSSHKRVLISNVVQSPQYREFLNVVNRNFDCVILDTPPIGFFIDSAILASVADRTLIVIAAGRVERALGKEIVGQLQKANAAIAGVALNFVDERHSHYGYAYRRYHYYQNDRAARKRGYDDEAPVAIEVKRA
jgi:capsular exopolysaccharide synthesis family protein